MDLNPYVDALRGDLEAAAAAGSDATRDTARLLSGALDASLRLCLLDALSAMAAEVTDAGQLGSVEIRMHGREPQVVVVADAAPPPEAPAAAPSSAPDGDDEGTTARVTLRLPEPLKAQAEGAAAAEGLSVNAWLVRAVALAVRGVPGVPPGGPHGHPGMFGARGRRISGYARG
jgi:hypothetical protein